ncbi:MAG: hypothetical protein RIC55_08080 [Pirellulaceae bacterium]
MTITIPAQGRMLDDTQVAKPSRVNEHSVPTWMRRRMIHAFPGHGDSNSGTACVLRAAKAVRADWLVNWGSTKYDGRSAFVAEPRKLSEHSLKSINEFAFRLDVRWLLCANTWSNPGAAVRILFYKPENT